jgi:Transposase
MIRLGAISILANETTKNIAGIDTHADTHHVAIINEHGKPLADKEFLAVGSGYRKIVDFINDYGAVTAVGVEGTGSYGAEIASRPPNQFSMAGPHRSRRPKMVQLSACGSCAPGAARYACLLTLKALASRCHSLGCRDRRRGRGAAGNP